MHSQVQTQKAKEKINQLMYMENIKLFTKKEREFETLMQTVKIKNQDIGIEFGIEKCAILLMKSRK